jgi:chlorite dismutase
LSTETATENPPVEVTQREFLKYTFFKVDSLWRRLERKAKTESKQQFASTVESFAKRMILKTYSLVGVRGDTDFMFWTISRKLEDFQDLVSSLLSTELGKYLEVPYSYLAITRKSEYISGHHHPSQEGTSATHEPGEAKYLFVYPFTKKREWYFLPFDERRLAMAEHFKIGHKYPSVKIHTGYSFGLDDQEFVLAFETDMPADFSDLVSELRSSEASRYTALEIPLFTCTSMDIKELLNILG